MRRTELIDGGYLRIEFSPAIEGEYILVTVCHLYEPKYNITEDNKKIYWYNSSGVKTNTVTLYRGIYDRKGIEYAVDSSGGAKLDWELSEHCFVKNTRSGTTMEMPNIDKMLGFEEGRSFPYNSWERSKNRSNIYGSRWIRVHCDAAEKDYNKPNGSIAEFPNCPIIGVQRFNINSYTKLNKGPLQSMTFRTIGDSGQYIDPGKIMIEFYIISGDSPRIPFPIPTRV